MEAQLSSVEVRASGRSRCGPGSARTAAAETGTHGDREIEAVIRLAWPGIEVPGVRIVSALAR
jgi:hypothetical protein